MNDLNEMSTERKAHSKSKRLRIPIIKYFWQASPLTGSRKKNIQSFFRKIPAFDDFSDLELYTFSKFLHIREYDANEVIFTKGEGGFGFYILFEGSVGISLCDKHQMKDPEHKIKFLTTLERYNYFGELSLLEDQNRRNASSISLEKTTLLAVYKPDLEELIEEHPVVAAKFIKALSYVVAKRLQLMAGELKITKDRLLESMQDDG